VAFPEEQVRVVALRHAEAVIRTREAARRDVRGGGIRANEAARLVGEMLQALERVAAALDGRYDRSAAGIHLDVAAQCAH